MKAWEKLPETLRKRLLQAGVEAEIWELRLRRESPIQITGEFGSRLCGESLSEREFTGALAALMDYSLCTWEDELSRGYFTTRAGFRVGVAGRYAAEKGERKLIAIHSACIRVTREIEGCADELLDGIGGGCSCLILSPPGGGKTTMLRDLARRISNEGEAVAVLDERCEIAAAWRGRATMNVGACTDVVEGISKPQGIPLIVRALAPNVLVTDELGDPLDGAAVLDAMRCGVRVMASAHARDIASALARPSLREAMESGFERVALLGKSPGTISGIYRREAGRWERMQ